MKDDLYPIPRRMKRALLDYICARRRPGGFLQAVFADRLSHAVGQADLENRRALPTYVRFIYNHVPSECWGSREAIDEWTSNNGWTPNREEIEWELERFLEEPWTSL